MSLAKDGIMVVLSSPSGAGKTTLVKKISLEKNYKISISHTTRKPRTNEIEGKDYFFVSEERFKDLIKNGKKNIGIVWAGSSSHKNDQHRSTTLENFKPILNTEGFNFYNLQFGERSKDIVTLGLEHKIINLEEELAGFMATAILIEKLDLIISIDTSMAHLAGALGKPVWTLLSFVPDWRWMLDRVDSPWYPSMRLFRQSKPGDWTSVIKNVRKALTIGF